MNSRNKDLAYFYQLLDQLEKQVGPKRSLSCANSLKNLPALGVYFFMEPGEMRSDSGQGMRVVRVGTHGLKSGAKTKLSQRLAQHKGTHRGGGNHRGSIFRLLLGTTLSSIHEHPTWGHDSTASKETRLNEAPIELQVSEIIGDMPFLYLEIPDEASPESLRGIVERNSIALLSNYEKTPLDSPSTNWRGYQCNREKVRKSGLWNQRHVNESYAPEFLDALEYLIKKVR